MYFFTGSILDGVSEMFLSGLSEFHWIPPDGARLTLRKLDTQHNWKFEWVGYPQR